MTFVPSPVLHLGTPAEILAALPHLCGFVPSESLVAVSLRGGHRRVGLTLRIDLPLHAAEADDAAMHVMSRLRHDGAAATVIVLYAAEGECDLLTRQLVEAADRAGLEVIDVLLVRSGRWWSMTCRRPGCCPPAGTPLLTAVATEATRALAAASALAGRSVLASRAELTASLAPPSAAGPALRRLQAATTEWRREVRRRGLISVRRGAVTAFEAAIAADPPTSSDHPSLLVALRDLPVRDEVGTLALDRDEALLAVLMTLAGSSVGVWDPPVCTLVAVVAWLRGDGALANVALDRAFGADPGYRMAWLVRTGLDAQLPPAWVRRWLRQTRTDLRAA